ARGGVALLRHGRVIGDPRAGAALGDDDAGAPQHPVGGYDGVAIDAEVVGQCAHRWHGVAGGQCPAVDEVPDALRDVRRCASADAMSAACVHVLESTVRSCYLLAELN